MLFFAYRFCGFSNATRLPLEQQNHATTGRPSTGLRVPSLLQSRSNCLGNTAQLKKTLKQNSKQVLNFSIIVYMNKLHTTGGCGWK
jgi:hypothetical protein